MQPGVVNDRSRLRYVKKACVIPSAPEGRAK